MKKLFALLLAAVMVFALCACGAAKTEEAAPAAPAAPAAAPATEAAPAAEAPAAEAPEAERVRFDVNKPPLPDKDIEVAEPVPGEPTAEKGSIKVIMAHSNAEDSIPQAYFNGFKKYVETVDPAFSCEIYPLAQLGGDREIMESCGEGNIQIVAMSTSMTANFVPDSCIFDLPFAIRSGDEMRGVMQDEEFWTAMSDAFADEGYKLGYISCGTFRALTSTVPVKTIDDFKGLDVRVMESDVHMGTFKALGCNTAVIPFNELYTSLQQGLVEAQDNAFNITISMKFQEVCPYLTATNHQPSNGTYLMNLDWFNSLTPDQQSTLMEGWIYGCNYGNTPEENDVIAIEEIMADGKHEYFELSAEDIDKGAKLCEPVWDIVREKCSTRIFDAYTGAIQRYRDANGG